MENNLIYRTLAYATKAHDGQFRKGTKTPYIVHPMSVAIFAYTYSNDEQVACAGLLHDTIEDTEVTYENIKKDFGSFIAYLVNSVTEENPEGSWRERKERALERVQDYGPNEVVLKASDVLANCQDLIRDYSMIGDDLWTRFSTQSDSQKMVEHYIRMLKTLKDRAKYLKMDHRIIEDLGWMTYEMNRTF